MFSILGRYNTVCLIATKSNIFLLLVHSNDILYSLRCPNQYVHVCKTCKNNNIYNVKLMNVRMMDETNVLHDV